MYFHESTHAHTFPHTRTCMRIHTHTHTHTFMPRWARLWWSEISWWLWGSAIVSCVVQLERLSSDDRNKTFVHHDMALCVVKCVGGDKLQTLVCHSDLNKFQIKALVLKSFRFDLLYYFRELWLRLISVLLDFYRFAEFQTKDFQNTI